MKLGALGLAGATTLAIGAAQAQQAGGDTAVYWMTADTTSGMAGMMGGQGADPGAIIGALMGGGPRASYAHALQLQLGTGRRAQGEPSAEHLPPAGLQVGASLPLVSPLAAPSTPPEPGSWPSHMERPRGRMLIYWGCGERARTGQPVVIDFARLTAGRVPPAFANADIRHMTPPAAGLYAGYGEWPNARSRTPVPPGGSLVGEHLVRGNYTPEIRFTLAPGQDFLAPVTLSGNSAAASGAIPLGWRPVAGARGWLASVMGASGNGDMVLWSSSEQQTIPMMMDHLSTEEIVRLVGRKVLLPAETTGCIVPAEVARAAPQSMLSVTAFGGDANFSHPVRPASAPPSWRPDWTVKLRTKSSHIGLLGMDFGQMMEGTGSEDQGVRNEGQARQRERSLLRRGLGRILGN
jgi:hypothetical protein